MNIKHNYAILLVALFCALTSSNIALCETPAVVSAKKKVDDIQVNIRKKYAVKESLNFYGISYDQLKTMVDETAKELLKELRDCSRWGRYEYREFERTLEEEVFNKLQQRARDNHAPQELSDWDVRKRIENHELTLRRQYGKPEQQRYYKVSYQELIDIIREVSRSMFGSYDNSMTTTASQLTELFRMHTDAVLEKLRARRECRP